MDLKTKLAFAFVSACLLSMGALGTFTWVSAKGMFVEDTERRLDARAESRKSELQRVFDDWERDVRALVTRTRLLRLTQSHLHAPTAASLARITRVLADAQVEGDAIRRLALFDAGGNLLAGASSGGPRPAVAAREAGVVYAGARSEGDAGLGFIFHAPLMLEGERIGFVEAEFAAGALDAVVGPTADVGDTAETLVVVRSAASNANEGSVVLARRGPDGEARPHPSEASEATDAALAGREEVFAAVSNRRGHEVMAATRSLADSGLGIVVQVDSAEVQGPADRLLKDMSDLGLALAAFAILGGTLLGFRLARPIQRLVEDVDRIRHGEIGLRLDVKGEDEVAFLAMSLNEFMNQLDHSSDLFQLGELEVLLVDGDAGSRRILQDLVQNWNMRPTVAENLAAALDAVEQAERGGRPFQLILLDESTTDADGNSLAGALRSSDWHPCPIITLSRATDSQRGAASAKTEVGRMLPKPVIASHLMEAILDEMGVSAEGLASTRDAYLRKTKPRKILLVEDSRLIQQVMIGFLESWGHAVTCVENGRLAVEHARAERFDLIVMDVEMPEMNGLDATVAIRANEGEGERVLIIALTAESKTGDRERCLAAGMDEYLAKPADPKRLYALIERCPARMLAEAPSSDAMPGSSS